MSKCPVGPVFPCASSREQFRTVSPLSISSFDRVERRQRVPAIRFSFPQNGKESGKERGEGEEENKSRATLVLSMVIPQKKGRRWTEVWSLSPCSCPPSLTPLRQVGSSAFFFTEGTGSPSPDHPPSRFIVEEPDFDGWTEARARGLDLRNFLKSDSGDAWVRANRNSRGLENVLGLLQRRCWVKLWEDGGTSLSRCWDIYSFSVMVGGCCLFDAKIIV